MESVEVVRTYLQMESEAGLIPAESERPGVRIERMAACPGSFFRYLYAEVGRRYHWVDRLVWTDDQVSAYLADPSVSIWLLTVGGAPAGYFELRRHEQDAVEIAYFGLLPEFIGQGLGKHLLTVATREAWRLGASRVWLHTCTLDDPAALPNYQARGFVPYKKETYKTTRGETVS